MHTPNMLIETDNRSKPFSEYTDEDYAQLACDVRRFINEERDMNGKRFSTYTDADYVQLEHDVRVCRN